MNLGGGSKKIKNKKRKKRERTITDQSLLTLEWSVSRIYHHHYHY